MVGLGELERRVMEVLWGSMGTELTVREVSARLPDYAYTTILTVLDRLEHKGMVCRDRAGRAHRYTAGAPREAYVASLMHDALDRSGDRDAALIRFAQTVSADEAAVLQRALAEGPVSPGGRPDGR